MKIYNRKEFLKLPENTFFIKWFRFYADGQLCIKNETIGDDFYYSSTAHFDADNSEEFVDKLEDALNNFSSLEIDLDTIGRDGLFEDDAMFMVYEVEDLKKLSAYIDKSIALRPPQFRQFLK